MPKKGVRNTKGGLNRGMVHSARGTHSTRRTGTRRRRTTTRAASVQPSVPPAAAGQAPCKVESESSTDATPYCLPSALSEASPLARCCLGSLTEQLYEGGNVKEPVDVNVKLEQLHDDVDLHHVQLDQAPFEMHPHSPLDGACSTSNAQFERSPGLQCSEVCRSPRKEDVLPWLDAVMPSTASASDLSPVSGSAEINPIQPNQNVMSEDSVGVNRTPNTNYGREEAWLAAATVNIPNHSTAVKVTKRSRQDMMLEEPVAIPSAQRTKPKVSRRISAFFNRSSFIRSLKHKDNSGSGPEVGSLAVNASHKNRKRVQLASFPGQQHQRLSRTVGSSDADHDTERLMENPRNTVDLPSEPSARSTAPRMPEQERDDRGWPSAAERFISTIPNGREVAERGAEEVIATAIPNATSCSSSIALCDSFPEIPFVTCFDEEPLTEQRHDLESQKVVGDTVQQHSLRDVNNSCDSCAVSLEDDIRDDTGEEASTEKDERLEEGELTDDDDKSTDNSPLELVQRSTNRKRSHSSSSDSSREDQSHHSGSHMLSKLRSKEETWLSHPCKYCGIVFCKLSEKLYHEISRHWMQQRYCRACDSTFCEERMDLHLRKSHRSQLRCFCGFKAETRWKLAQHKEEDHDIPCF